MQGTQYFHYEVVVSVILGTMISPHSHYQLDNMEAHKGQQFHRHFISIALFISTLSSSDIVVSGFLGSVAKPYQKMQPRDFRR